MDVTALRRSTLDDWDKARPKALNALLIGVAEILQHQQRQAFIERYIEE